MLKPCVHSRIILNGPMFAFHDKKVSSVSPLLNRSASYWAGIKSCLRHTKKSPIMTILLLYCTVHRGEIQIFFVR